MQDEAELLKLVANRLVFSKQFWRPLNARQDYWALMYFMQDMIQQSKSLGQRRYITNQPRTAVDLALSIQTRNDAFWRIPMFGSGDENNDTRRIIGKVERSLGGIMHSIDDSFSARGRGRFWKRVAFQGLLRGMIVSKVHLTKVALEYGDSPVIAEVYDARLCFPHFDGFGLNHIVMESVTTCGALADQYPDSYPESLDTDFNPNKRSYKIEYWSNSRPNRPGISGTLAVDMPSDQLQSSIDLYSNIELVNGQAKWLIKPYEHGYKPHEFPIVCTMVNGADIVAKPQLGDILNSQLMQRAEMMGIPNAASWWQGENAWAAEMGRGILSSVEEQVPQYNEIMATILHHFSISAFGQWMSHTPDGQFPEFEPGSESRIALTPDEQVERMEIQPINQDAYRIVGILSQEFENGTLSSILRAGGAQAATGVLFQQMSNAALNTLEPYNDGLQQHGTAVGGSILGQLQAGDFSKFEVYANGGGSNRKKSSSVFVVEFDPKADLEIFEGRRLRPQPFFKPALPDDLATRIQAARFALDPRRPILSLVTVLEDILQIEDPVDEMDRIWEDMATQDPVMVFGQMYNALMRKGETELAQQMQQNEFRQAFMRDAQFRQVQAQASQIPGGAGPGGPEAMPPAAGGGAFNTATAQDQGMQGGGGATAAEGAGVLGSVGARLGV